MLFAIDNPVRGSIILDMETRTRRKRRNRRSHVVAEPHDSYSFYLPVEMMERFRAAAEAAGRPYSEYVTEAIALFLAVNVQILETHKQGGHSNAAD